MHDHAERTSARDDCRLMNRIGRRDIDRDDGMAGLVIGSQLLLFLGHGGRAAFCAHHHLVLGVLEFCHRHQPLVAAGGKECGLVDEVHQIGTRETRRTTRENLEVDIRRHRHVAGVNLEDLLAADDVGVRHGDLTVETARTQKRGVENVGAVGRCDQDDAFIRLEAVHLHQQLVERLFAFVVTAAQTSATMATDGVDFVDEDDARRVLLGLVEHVADTAGADTDEHFNEIRTGNREERHIGFAGDGAGEQCLTGAGRADEQHAAGNAAAETLEFLRIAQELDDFLEVAFGFVDTSDVIEGHAAMRFGQQLGLGLAKTHRAPRTTLHLAHQEQPDTNDQQDWQEIDQEAEHARRRIRFRTHHHGDVLALKLGHQAVIDLRCIRLEDTIGVAIDTACPVAGELDLADTAAINCLDEIRIRDFGRTHPIALALEHAEQCDEQHCNNGPQGDISEVGVHIPHRNNLGRSVKPESRPFQGVT
jgi:hypothetical protein